jgi:hypothetical protein
LDLGCELGGDPPAQPQVLPSAGRTGVSVYQYP